MVYLYILVKINILGAAGNNGRKIGEAGDCKEWSLSWCDANGWFYEA
jgi:hypothetical protein